MIVRGCAGDREATSPAISARVGAARGAQMQAWRGAYTLPHEVVVFVDEKSGQVAFLE